MDDKLRNLGLCDDILRERFIDACWILIKKPHILNHRLFGSSIVSCVSSKSGLPVGLERSTRERKPDLTIVRRLIPRNREKYSPVLERCILSERSLRIETAESEVASSSPPEGAGGSSAKPIPVVEASVIEIRLGVAETVVILGSGGVPRSFTEALLRRLAKWMGPKSEIHASSQIQLDSLSLIDPEVYNLTYSRLKKEAASIVAIWPERTNPEKFVHEDVAIASYLISLWDPLCQGRKVKFVDVGCGNGLLVYILLKEGHEGFGVDVRRRELWKLCPDNLFEGAVSPETRYSDVDWWIGNHSDELTPWIPFLATMSNPNAKVFLIPCCPFGLHGKYQRKNPELSQYQSYLTFLRDEFLPDCGFRVEMDKLRIPSTRRVCLVCRERRVEPYEAAVDRLQQRWERERGSFVPRPKEIPVRNCTQINRSILEPLVNKIAFGVLTQGSGEDAPYNRGGEVALSEAVKLLKSDELQVLKSQCGGLQTLLKNNYHIFKVTKGKITLRIPEGITPNGDERRVRTRACWFHARHPQGCPMNASTCRFVHTELESAD
ncbi:probable tRNA (uracil-O(2)-)-methyltransferase [Galendromus occidentalis]|uniref:tRNA (uracil-O(2)-)-methyltransferase n=1 Tax=Galendromus occidentalis TaxID=34638 RepID=A0AAJ6VYQ6_9ACAR|nr:probable tRNA (uracil-O(2)-)-methyltransferase [Galendromus occidentalis]